MVTLVLYFGYKGHWNAPKTLMEALNVPDILKPYVTDVKVNLFEIACLARDQVNMFKSDFKEVARYFVQMRESDNYHPGTDYVAHVYEVMNLLSVFDKNRRFEAAVNDIRSIEGVKSVSKWFNQSNAQQPG